VQVAFDGKAKWAARLAQFVHADEANCRAANA
jgi:hypothetical protein